MRIAIWPRRSWARSTKYLAKRVLRLTASPHAIAAGIAAGVFASFTPYLGFHFFMAFIVCYIIGGNMIAGATGTFFGNPLTFPFIWSGTHSTGNFILNGSFRGEGRIRDLKSLKRHDFWDLSWDAMGDLVHRIWEPILKPMTVGAIPLGILAGVIFYLVTRWAAIAFQVSRRNKISQKAAEYREETLAKVAPQNLDNTNFPT
ncbi:MAG: DUF2062 domain-containing protein [Nitratireductor sp.]